MTETNDRPLVSIIIPCFRQAQFLPTAVDSALAQSYPNVEVIVVNDGSDDDTEAVAKGYGDRIHYVWRPNGGLPAARNTGMAHAKGAYLKFCDSDDHLHPDTVAWQMEALAGRTDAVSHTTVRLYRDGHPDQYDDHVPVARALLPDLLRDLPWGNLNGFLFPAGLAHKAGGFDESLRWVEDWDFLCRVGLCEPAFLPDARVGAYYRLRPQSMSTNRRGMAETRTRLLLRLHDVLRHHPRKEWFGIELLRSEQGTYQTLVEKHYGTPDSRRALLVRIRELQRHLGQFGMFGWRFRVLTLLLGYAGAEHLRGFIVRNRRRRPAATIDMGDWRATE